MARGIFITLEGGDGAGKTTQAQLLAARREGFGREVLMLHEPGGTRMGAAVRQILLGGGEDLDPTAELLLFEAARAQLVSKVIRPALLAEKVVICDRFTDSTVAYQGYGRGLDLARIEQLNQWATAGLLPDRTVLLDLDVKEGLERARALNGGGGDRMEQEELSFHEAVHRGFARQAAAHPQRIRVVPQMSTPGMTGQAVFDAVADLFAGDGQEMR